MPRNYRNKRYGKKTSFSRPGGQYRAPRAYGRNPAKRYQMRTPPKRENGGDDIKLTIGRKLLWIYNNTGSEVVIRPGEYIVLEIASEYENNMGLNIRARPRASSNEGGDEVDFKPQDWV